MNALQQAANEQGFTRVLCVQLTVGKLTAVEQSQFKFSFDVLSKNTLAEHARLDIEEVEGKGYCAQCKKHVPMESLYSACPDCKSWGLEVVEGKELKISRLEVI